MARTDNFRKQHVEIMNFAREINGLLADPLSEAAAAEIRPMLSKLAGLVSLHLAMEDKTLYPAMVNHSDAATRATATRYSNEMGSLASAFGDYVGNWRTTAQMRAEPARFATESKAVFNALSKRIHHENVELYPLFDKLGA